MRSLWPECCLPFSFVVRKDNCLSETIENLTLQTKPITFWAMVSAAQSARDYDGLQAAVGHLNLTIILLK